MFGPCFDNESSIASSLRLRRMLRLSLSLEGPPFHAFRRANTSSCHSWRLQGYKPERLGWACRVNNYRNIPNVTTTAPKPPRTIENIKKSPSSNPPLALAYGFKKGYGWIPVLMALSACANSASSILAEQCQVRQIPKP